LNIKVSQGSAATEFMCGRRFYFTVFRSLSMNPKVKELLKSVHICQRYSKNKSGPVFSDSQCSLVKLVLRGHLSGLFTDCSYISVCINIYFYSPVRNPKTLTLCRSGHYAHVPLADASSLKGQLSCLFK